MVHEIGNIGTRTGDNITFLYKSRGLHTSQTMAFFRLWSGFHAALLVLLAVTALAQQTTPSNNTADIPPYDAAPRFWVNGTGFDHFEILPLGWYANISPSNFRNIEVSGRLLLVDASNANDGLSDGIIYMSCDPQAYTGNIGANDVLQMIASSSPGNAIILYSAYANHCEASDLRLLAAANGVFTTLNNTLAGNVASQIQNDSRGMPATVSPDLNSYHDPPNSSGYNTNNGSPGPTTAVAMIILYTITGLITALFIVIIVTGAIRAHRHPERYGPRMMVGRPHRSRAKGLARAMLDTIPIVKFGEREDATKKEEAADIEMAPTSSSSTDANAETKSKAVSVNEVETASASNADGTDEAGHLGCSICTEDFSKGEEVRVLPCNHKFHPDCVDPWLLNVSGTCPLCRIDLRPPEERPEGDTEAASSGIRDATTTDGTTTTAATAATASTAPPLGGRRGSNAGRRDTNAFASLRSVAHASREDRIAALRRFRQQRQRQAEQTGSSEQPDEQTREETRGVTRRLRERFRVRTRRQGEESTTTEEATS